MKLNSDGTTTPFDSLQTFEVGMLEGCDAGSLLVEDELSPYFNNITQPIYFVADSNITENDTVLIRVGVIDNGGGGGSASRPVKINSKEKELLTLRKNKTPQQKPLGENTATYCFLGEIDWSNMGDGFVVVGNECDEEIVFCDNYQPPKFEEVGTITVLGKNDPWQWIDEQGSQQTTNTGDACNLNPQPGEFGKTYIMSKIGDFAPGNLVYNLLDDTKVTVCQDKNDPTDPIWRYSVENLRVPIFRDHCPAWAIANDYIDLLDGTNADTLAKYIKNCTDYTNVMSTLDWWWIGPYRQLGQTPSHKFYFSAGVIAHEDIHVKQMRDGGTKYFPVGSIYNEMNNGSTGFRALLKYQYSAIIAKCPEDALAAVQGIGTMEERVKIQLDAALTVANDLKSLGGQDNQGRDNSELEADEYARPKYDEIKTNIENWAKQQSWWCIPWPIVGDDYYRGCDNSDCTP